MLQNAYLVAKIGADTAENERNFAEFLPKFGNYPTGPLPYGRSARARTSWTWDAGGGDPSDKSSTLTWVRAQLGEIAVLTGL